MRQKSWFVENRTSIQFYGCATYMLTYSSFLRLPDACIIEACDCTDWVNGVDPDVPLASRDKTLGSYGLVSPANGVEYACCTLRTLELAETLTCAPFCAGPRPRGNGSGGNRFVYGVVVVAKLVGVGPRGGYVWGTKELCCVAYDILEELEVYGNAGPGVCEVWQAIVYAWCWWGVDGPIIG